MNQFCERRKKALHYIVHSSPGYQARVIDMEYEYRYVLGWIYFIDCKQTSKLLFVD